MKPEDYVTKRLVKPYYVQINRCSVECKDCEIKKLANNLGWRSPFHAFENIVIGDELEFQEYMANKPVISSCDKLLHWNNYIFEKNEFNKKLEVILE
jgi:hypothetical protein